MIYTSQELEQQAILHAAQKICTAARTAPKAKGLDMLETLVLTGAEKDALADRMDDLAEPFGYGFFHRDADCVRKADAIVLFGTKQAHRGLGMGCGYCRHKDCAECAEKGGVCAFDPLDLGIAIGSAAASAMDERIDSRVLFSAGRAALEDNLMGEDVTMAFALVLSVSGKSPFFDRK